MNKPERIEQDPARPRTIQDTHQYCAHFLAHHLSQLKILGAPLCELDQSI
jgi:hypothetical protein